MTLDSSSAMILSLLRIPLIEAHSSFFFSGALLSGDSAAGGEGGKTFGKWNCVVDPSEFYCGGAWLAPAARIDNKELAKQFIDFFTINEETGTAYTEKNNEFMSNKKVMQNIIAKDEYKGSPVLGGQNELKFLDIVVDGIDVKGKITPYDAKIGYAFDDSLYDYCYISDMTLDDTMRVFKKNVHERIKDVKVKAD